MKTDSIYIVEMSDSETSSNFSKNLKATRELIELVEQKRCLWDRSVPEYRDKAEKDAAWHDIYLEIEPAFDEMDDTKKNVVGNLITRKWYNVRDSYVKARKGYKSKPYKYAPLMKFLDPIYLEASRSKKNFPENEDEIGDENGDESEWLNEVFVDVDDNADTEETPPPKKPKVDYTVPIEEGEENIIAILANLIQKEEDEDRAFFKSITPAVKKLSENSKFEFRIEVMKLIKTLKIKDRKSVKVKREIHSDSE